MVTWRALPISLVLACEPPVGAVADVVVNEPVIDPAPVAPARSLRLAEPPELQPAGTPGSSSSSLALARIDGRLVGVLADQDERRLAIVELHTGSVVAQTDLVGAPAHVIVDRRGAIWVALRDVSQVVGLTLACKGERCTPTLAVRETFATPREPIALGLADDDATVLVACGWGRALVGHAVRPGGRELAIALAREPRGFVVDEDGDRVWVAHAVGSRVSVLSLRDAVVARERELHWRDMVKTGDFDLANVPRFAVQGLALASAAGRVHVPMVLAYPGEPDTEAEGYGASIQGLEPFFPHEPVLVELAPDGDDARLRLRHEVIAADKARRSEQRRAYARDRPPCLLPRATAVDGTGATLLVACQDLGQVVALALDGRTLERAESQRWSVGVGVEAIAIDEENGETWAWSPFDRRLARLDDGEAQPARTIALAAQREIADADGRRAFHRQRSFDGRSCASCHVDGRDDGLVWQSPLGMVSTPVLAGRTIGTAPFGWHGERATLDGHIRRTFTRLRADKPDDAMVAALAGWIGSMPSYRDAADELDDAALRGRELFRSPTLGCAGCHADDDGTDGVGHRIGHGAELDTPSLRFVGDTGPYMHDGRYATLRELLVATDGKMGTTAALDERSITDLVAYLRVL